MDVKENITNILLAVGVRFEDGLSEKDIRKKLNLQNTTALLTAVQRAVGRQLQNDRTNARNVFAKGVAYDMGAVLQLLTQTTNLSPDAANALLNAMCQDDYGVTDIVLHGVVEGLPEQKDMTPALAEQSAGVLNNIMQADYQTYLQQNKLSAEQFTFADFQKQRNKNKITTMLASLIGDAAQAENFLNQPIDENHPILANNKALQDKFLAAKAERTDGQGPVQVIDVLTMMSKSITKAQVLAFYDNRVMEQNKVGEKGERLPDSSPTKIDNVLGKTGREATEKVVGQHLTNRLMPQTKVAQGKPLPDHKWRGYNRLAQLIKSTVVYMYSTINSGWFAEKMYNRLKPHNQVLLDGDANATRWDVPYQAMPEAYQGTPAGEFFTLTHARMLDDKIKVTALSTQLQNALQPDHTLEDLNKYMAGKAAGNTQNNAQLDQCVQLYDQILYYQHRITMGQNALVNVEEKVATDANTVRDSILFDNLNHDIVCLKPQPRVGEEPEDYQQRCQTHATFIAKNSVSGIVDAELDAQANTDLDSQSNKHMQSGLQQFLRANNSQNALEKAASYEMLADLFGIRDKFNAGKVTVEDLQDLLSNQHTGPFNPVKANAMIQGLQNMTLGAEKCRGVLHDSAVTFLQEKYQYSNYDLTKTAAEQIKNM